MNAVQRVLKLFHAENKQREEDMAITPPGNPGHSKQFLASQLAAMQYQQALMQAHSVNQSALQSNYPHGLYGTNPNNAAGTGPVSVTPNTGGVLTGGVLPSPTGINTNIAFTDATGHIWGIAVDIAYVSILTQISNAHMPIQSPGSQLKYTLPMQDGEFTEDEMSLAEDIIQEMSNGKTGKSETHPQA